MSQDSYKLSYNPATMRVRVTLSLSALQASSQVPTDLVTRAKNKMEAELASGRVAGFNLYENRLTQLWQILQKAGQVSSEVVEVVLADGFPSAQGLELSMDEAAPNSAIVKAMPGSEQKRSWPLEFFVAWFYYQWSRLMPKELRPHDAQLTNAWLQFRHGKLPFSFRVGSKPEQDQIKPFGVGFNRARSEVSLVVSDPNVFRDQNSMSQLIEKCLDATEKLTGSGAKHLVLRKDQLVSAIKGARVGIEAYGIDLPLVVLVASGDQTIVASTKNSVATADRKASESAKPTTKAPIGGTSLPIVVSEDKMEATVGKWDMNLYDTDLTWSQEWLNAELKRAGIRHGINQDALIKLLQQFEVKGDPTGMMVAVGTPGVGGKDPYLHHSYRDQSLDLNEAAAIDIRELQQRNIVKQGQLIAEIRYRSARQRGVNVFGEDVAPPPCDVLDVVMGEGVERRGNHRFYALYDGIPQIVQNSLSLSQILVHNGDVNLRSGNIRFEGNVEIKGSIDTGAVVDVKGDLMVTGSIRAAFVNVGGSLKVGAGVTTGDGKGIVRVRGEVVADFIENSRVVSGSNVKVRRNIINSKVFCGGFVEADKANGVIAGGSLSARLYVRTGKLGFSKGAKTFLKVGVDWRAELAVSIRLGRIERLEQSLDEARQEMRELMRKNKAQLTKKHEQMIEDYRLYLQKGRLILNKMRDHLEVARKLVSYEEDARVYVHDILSSNVAIELSGTPIPIGAKDVAGVEVTPKKRRGSHILAIDEGDDKGDGNSAA